MTLPNNIHIVIRAVPVMVDTLQFGVNHKCFTVSMVQECINDPEFLKTAQPGASELFSLPPCNHFVDCDYRPLCSHYHNSTSSILGVSQVFYSVSMVTECS